MNVLEFQWEQFVARLAVRSSGMGEGENLILIVFVKRESEGDTK